MLMFNYLGVKKGDRVAIYMPMIIELVVAMLACARIGAIHSIVVSASSLLCIHMVIKMCDSRKCPYTKKGL